MPSSFNAYHDETRPLRLLDEHGDPPRPDGAFSGVVMLVLAVVIPVLVLAAL